jgi:hypothetical protein
MLRELAGFAVLSLWILVPLGILLVGVIAVCVAAVLQRTRWKRWVASLTAALVVVLIPTWDEILGRLYFSRLCATEGGVRIFRQVDLPVDYWDADGRPKFIKPNGDMDSDVLQHRFDVVIKSRKISGVFRIQALDFRVVEKASQVPLGEISSYGYFGGWLVNATSLHVTGIRCPNRPRSYDEAVLMATVRPQTIQSK